MNPTIQIKAIYLESIAKLALKKMEIKADKKWNDEIEKSGKPNTWLYWFLNGYWKFPNRESIERHLGKPDDGIMHWDTFYFGCYSDTTQKLMYQDFIKAGKRVSTRHNLITLSLSDYNTLKSYEDELK